MSRLALAHPRYWPAWLLVPFTFVIAWLPWPVQRLLGNLLGDLTWLALPGRRHITRRNLELCFPDWSTARREQVARESFRSTGIAVFESAMAWWRDPGLLAARTHFIGLEKLQAAAAEGRGVLLLGAHYTTLEWMGAAVSARIPIDTIYRPQNNAAMERFVSGRRTRIYKRQLDRFDVRAIFRALKEGDVVWYTGDQDFGRKHAVFIPFFGVTAATVTAGSRFARVNDSVVMSVDFHRKEDGTYVCEFAPLPGTYPSGDEAADATLMNTCIEAGIRKAPGQYMWYHKRFKTRPQRGDHSLY
ncbi:MAG: LpxL/LpxP family Kdo(2)-lipid IV(A) lauroyl/palmitoleoyl acyltransferase [Pseudomonadota bacterium]